MSEGDHPKGQDHPAGAARRAGRADRGHPGGQGKDRRCQGTEAKVTGKLSSQTSRLETMLRRKNPEKRLAEKYTHEERRQAMKELDEMIATATRLREIIAKVERSADEAQEV